MTLPADVAERISTVLVGEVAVHACAASRASQDVEAIWGRRILTAAGSRRRWASSIPTPRRTPLLSASSDASTSAF